MSDRIRPFLKWAGGKTAVLPELRRVFPKPDDIVGYYEPFLGGGAAALDVLARLEPPTAVLADRNPEVVEAWRVVRDDVEALIVQVAAHAERHDADHFERVRSATGATPVERAARTLYLNKTCFNGLYRVNKSGKFNVPLGRYARPAILDAPLLRRVSALIQGVELRVGSFEQTLTDVGAGDLVYMDPPYDPLSSTSRFTAYDGHTFTTEHQRRLAATFAALVDRGAHVVLSNSNTPLIRELYAGFERRTIHVLRRVNVKGTGRGPVKEVIVVGRRRGRRRSGKGAATR